MRLKLTLLVFTVLASVAAMPAGGRVCSNQASFSGINKAYYGDGRVVGDPYCIPIVIVAD